MTGVAPEGLILLWFFAPGRRGGHPAQSLFPLTLPPCPLPIALAPICREELWAAPEWPFQHWGFLPCLQGHTDTPGSLEPMPQELPALMTKRAAAEGGSMHLSACIPKLPRNAYGRLRVLLIYSVPLGSQGNAERIEVKPTW